MIAVDTNILLRYVLLDDAAQADKARQLIDVNCSSSEPALVSLITLVEFWSVLRKRRTVPKEVVLDLLDALIGNAHLAFSEPEVLLSALVACRHGAADFPDYLIYFDNRRHGATQTLTFDKDAAHADFMTHLT